MVHRVSESSVDYVYRQLKLVSSGAKNQQQNRDTEESTYGFYIRMYVALPWAMPAAYQMLQLMDSS